MRTRLLLCLITSLAGLLVGFTYPDRPQYHVNDYAHAIDTGSFAQIELRFRDFEQKTGRQAAVAVFSTLDDEPIDTVATKLFEKWRLGSKKENDGVLLVLGLQEHKARIEVGYGLEGQLPDALAGRIIHDDLFPLLRQNQVAQAIAVFEKRLEQIIIEGKTLPPRKTDQKVSPATVVLMVFFFFAWLTSTWLSYQRRRTLGGRGAYANSGLWWLGGGGWGGGGGGFGGGSGGSWGGGGGGSSGGGGASGQW